MQQVGARPYRGANYGEARIGGSITTCGNWKCVTKGTGANKTSSCTRRCRTISVGSGQAAEPGELDIAAALPPPSAAMVRAVNNARALGLDVDLGTRGGLPPPDAGCLWKCTDSGGNPPTQQSCKQVCEPVKAPPPVADPF